MTYEPYDWADGPAGGTPITAERLEHLESQYQAVTDDIDDPGTPLGSTVAAAIADQVAGGLVPVTPQPRTVVGTIPAGEFGWLAEYGISQVRITTARDGSARGSVGITPETLFDRYSTARTAPGTTFYVNVGGPQTVNGVAWAAGSDAAAGTSEATAFQSIWKAIAAVNTAAPAAGGRIYVLAGNYVYRNSMNNVPSTNPLGSAVVDIALIAVGGKVTDAYAITLNPPTIHPTYTNLYQFNFATTGEVARVVIDKSYVDEFGNARRYRRASSVDVANTTPGTFWPSSTGTSALVNPFPGAPMNTSTVVVYGPASRIVRDIGFYLGGATASDSWEFLGGNVANLILSPSAAMAARKVAVISRATGKYAGRDSNDANSFAAAVNWRGLLACFDCVGVAPDRDAFNMHTANPNPSRLLTVNCKSFDTGQGPATGAIVTSRNGYTLHENAEGVDIAGDYRLSRGGTVHNINTSKLYALGTLAADDLGDGDAGGTTPPTQYKAGDTAQIWLERCLASGDADNLAYAADAAAAIRLIDPLPTPLPSSGPVTVLARGDTE